MKSTIEVVTKIHLESNNEGKGTLSNVEFSFTVGEGLDGSLYINETGELTKFGCQMLTEIVTRGLAANVFANQETIAMPEHLKFVDQILNHALISYLKGQTKATFIQEPLNSKTDAES